MPMTKRKKKAAPLTNRKFDTKYLGEEPEFNTSKKNKIPTDEVERKVLLAKTLNWYNYFYSSKEQRPFMVTYAKDVLGWSKEHVAAIKSAKDNAFNVTAEKYARMHMRGWVFNEREQNLVLESFEKVRDERLAQIKEEKSKRKVVVEHPKAVVCKSRLLIELDAMEDEWINGEKTEIDLAKLQLGLNDPKGEVERWVKPWIEGRLEALRLLKKGDSYMKEHFANIPAREATRQIKVLEQCLSDVERMLAKKARTVKTKAQKAPSAERQAKDFKFLATSDEFKIQSLKAIQVIGQARLFMFDTKNRVLHSLIAKDNAGFGGKGMAITNFDTKSSRKWKIRKPEEILPIIETKTNKQIDQELAKLSTKPQETNGRTSTTMVLLKVTPKP